MSPRHDQATKPEFASLQPVRVLCAANADYAVPLCVMLVSLVDNLAKNRRLEIFILARNFPEDKRQDIERSICANRPDFELTDLHWIVPDLTLLESLQLNGHVSLDSCSRLLAPQVLPEDCDRVLYLDSDMVIRADVSELFDLPNEETAIHAAPDIGVPFVGEPKGVFNYAELGIPATQRYFNSGVMLLNLRRWREANIGDRVFDYLHRHGSSIHFFEQGALNAVLYDSWTEIDLVWNQSVEIIFPEKCARMGLSKEKRRSALAKPKIVHYTGAVKPWLGFDNILPVPRFCHFFTYLEKTLYRGTIKAPSQVELLMGATLYSILWTKIRPLLLRLIGRLR
jgi:lipopolysaccharide biosynthesis glycosyltransferase